MNQIEVSNRPDISPQLPPKEERDWGMFSHLSGFLGYVVPLSNIAAPLIMWKMKEEEMPAASIHAKESLNFQISVTLYLFVAALLAFALIGFVLLPALAIFDLVCVIKASIAASNGQSYYYPLCIRFVK